MLLRINKFISNAGVASRRKAENLIRLGRVTVNGELCKSLSSKIDPKVDIVRIDGRQIFLDKKIYVLLNKPKGYMCSLKDPHYNQLVSELIDIDQRVYPVGRLDVDSEGLIILTNDGDMAYRLMHPKYQIEKTYIASIKGALSKEELNLFRNGIVIDERLTYPAKISLLKKKSTTSEYTIKIHEGRNRQIRKMFAYFNKEVFSLIRVAIGEIILGNLPMGEYRFLEEEEIEYLKSI